MRAVPGRDKTLVCTGCDYKVDLDEEAPAFLNWVEKMTEQSNLSKWGRPREVLTTERWGAADEGTVQWHLDAARTQVLSADAHDLAAFDSAADIYLGFFFRSLDEAPVANDQRHTEGRT